jgi:hypothetical protein
MYGLQLKKKKKKKEMGCWAVGAGVGIASKTKRSCVQSPPDGDRYKKGGEDERIPSHSFPLSSKAQRELPHQTKSKMKLVRLHLNIYFRILYSLRCARK